MMPRAFDSHTIGNTLAMPTAAQSVPFWVINVEAASLSPPNR